MVMTIKRKFMPDFVYVVTSSDYEPLYAVFGDDEADAIRSDKAVNIGEVYKVPTVTLLGSWQPVNDEEVENG